MAAVRFDMDGGDATESRDGARSEYEPAAKFQKSRARQNDLIVIVKGHDRRSHRFERVSGPCG